MGKNSTRSRWWNRCPSSAVGEEGHDCAAAREKAGLGRQPRPMWALPRSDVGPAGHAMPPRSEEYISNIGLPGKSVRRPEKGFSPRTSQEARLLLGKNHSGWDVDRGWWGNKKGGKKMSEESLAGIWAAYYVGAKSTVLGAGWITG